MFCEVKIFHNDSGWRCSPKPYPRSIGKKLDILVSRRNIPYFPFNHRIEVNVTRSQLTVYCPLSIVYSTLKYEGVRDWYSNYLSSRCDVSLLLRVCKEDNWYGAGLCRRQLACDWSRKVLHIAMERALLGFKLTKLKTCTISSTWYVRET